MDSRILVETALRVVIATDHGKRPKASDIETLRRQACPPLRNLSVDQLAYETVLRETEKELACSRNIRLASRRRMRRRQSA